MFLEIDSIVGLSKRAMSCMGLSRFIALYYAAHLQMLAYCSSAVTGLLDLADCLLSAAQSRYFCHAELWQRCSQHCIPTTVSKPRHCKALSGCRIIELVPPLLIFCMQNYVNCTALSCMGLAVQPV